MQAKTLRFYLDENVPIEIARQLKSRGIDAVTVLELGFLGDSDEEHLRRAAEMQRVLCTYDSDYVDLASQGIKHAGIVFGQQEIHYIGEWVKYLELMHAVYRPEEMLDKLEYL